MTTREPRDETADRRPAGKAEDARRLASASHAFATLSIGCPVLVVFVAACLEQNIDGRSDWAMVELILIVFIAGVLAVSVALGFSIAFAVARWQLARARSPHDPTPRWLYRAEAALWLAAFPLGSPLLGLVASDVLLNGGVWIGDLAILAHHLLGRAAWLVPLSAVLPVLLVLGVYLWAYRLSPRARRRRRLGC